VVIDGVIGAAPGGWVSRPDLTALFPVAQFSGVVSALAVLALDTTTLANGLHTISWLVTDNQGAATGVGSRYFTVSNGSGLVLSPLSAFARSASADRRSLGGGWSVEKITGRRGFDLDAPDREYTADADGRITIQSEELDRIELQLGGVEGSREGVEGARRRVEGTLAGYLRVAGGLAPLPIGSHLDPATGTFTWQPGVAFVGTYDLVFARLEGSAPVARRDVRVVLNPKGSNRVGPQTVIDIADGRIVAGWAVDLDSQIDTGVDTLHVWAYPVEEGRTGDPIFVGAVEYGGARPDVAAIYGERFLKSGYGIRLEGLAGGTYDLAVFAYSTVTGRFAPAKTVRIVVR